MEFDKDLRHKGTSVSCVAFKGDRGVNQRNISGQPNRPGMYQMRNTTTWAFATETTRPDQP